jgi:hypothetical protein
MSGRIPPLDKFFSLGGDRREESGVCDGVEGCLLDLKLEPTCLVLFVAPVKLGLSNLVELNLVEITEEPRLFEMGSGRV